MDIEATEEQVQDVNQRLAEHHGLLIEVHPDPPKALYDGAQSLNPGQFASLMGTLKAVAEAVGREI